MGWFPCAGKSTKKPRKKKTDHDDPIRPSTIFTSSSPSDSSVHQMLLQKEVKHMSDPCGRIKLLLDIKIEIPKLNLGKEDLKGVQKTPTARAFTFRELKAATKNFRSDCFLGEEYFGKVYKGRVKGIKEVVAIKKLYWDGLQGNKKFLVKVLMLSLLHHPNLANFIGYCVDGDHRLLVYEYMPLGSLADHLHDLSPQKPPLDWNARMRIAAGVARGLEYLHDTANPPVICRDLKSSKILLGEGYYPKLSYVELAKLGPIGDKCYVSSRVIGTVGYFAPEYAMAGKLTVKSDIYSFGVILLEIITGRKAIDKTKTGAERSLIAWARPFFRDRKKISQMVDPKLKGLYSMRHLRQAVALAMKCVQEQDRLRPTIADVVTALSYLVSEPYMPESVSVQSPHSASSNSPLPKKVYT